MIDDIIILDGIQWRISAKGSGFYVVTLVTVKGEPDYCDELKIISR